MVEEGVRPARPRWRQACWHARRSAHKRPWSAHNAELSDPRGVGGETRRGAAHRSRASAVAQFLRVCRRSKVVSMSPESLAETAVFAGDQPCHGEAIRDAPARFHVRQRALITASATLCPSGLSLGSLRRTEGCWRDLDSFEDRRKHRPGFLAEKPLRRGRSIGTREEKVVEGVGPRSRRRPLSASQHNPTTSRVGISFHCNET